MVFVPGDQTSGRGADGAVRQRPGVGGVTAVLAALQRGEFIADAAVAVGTYRKQGTRWLFAAGGVRPRRGHDLKAAV